MDIHWTSQKAEHLAEAALLCWLGMDYDDYLESRDTEVDPPMSVEDWDEGAFYEEYVEEFVQRGIADHINRKTEETME